VEDKYDFYAILGGEYPKPPGPYHVLYDWIRYHPEKSNALAYAIEKVCKYGGLKFSPDKIGYYIPKYPNAKRIVIVSNYNVSKPTPDGRYALEIIMPSQCDFKLVKVYQFSHPEQSEYEKKHEVLYIDNTDVLPTKEEHSWKIYDLLNNLKRDTKYRIWSTYRYYNIKINNIETYPQSPPYIVAIW
jgi:hypothetical protein